MFARSTIGFLQPAERSEPSVVVFSAFLSLQNYASRQTQPPSTVILAIQVGDILL